MIRLISRHVLLCDACFEAANCEERCAAWVGPYTCAVCGAESLGGKIGHSVKAEDVKEMK